MEIAGKNTDLKVGGQDGLEQECPDAQQLADQTDVDGSGTERMRKNNTQPGRAIVDPSLWLTFHNSEASALHTAESACCFAACLYDHAALWTLLPHRCGGGSWYPGSFQGNRRDVQAHEEG